MLASELLSLVLKGPNLVAGVVVPAWQSASPLGRGNERAKIIELEAVPPHHEVPSVLCPSDGFPL